MQHSGTVTLETERLILRRFRPEDAQRVYDNWTSDAEVARYLTWEPHRSAAETAALLDIWIADYEKPETYNWVLERKADGMPVGNISVTHFAAETACAALGWCLSRSLWGQGYMPEAAEAVLDYLFETVGMLRIEATHNIENPKSGRVMQKIGMTKEGVLRQHGFARGVIVDEVWYSILADEYRSGAYGKTQ
ncbi:MAG: GNAT family N-acetyltransferase [Oscillospiraceae bacterium]|nr:GNAT family N-acetyltransferase [Oscillospiraceae bacterium]